MYALSDNSQNMQGKRIDALCLEERSEMLPLGSVFCRPPLRSGGSQGQMPESLGDRPAGVWGGGGSVTARQVATVISQCQQSQQPTQDPLQSWVKEK